MHLMFFQITSLFHSLSTKRVFPPATEVCPQLWVGVDFAICASSRFSMYGIDKIVHSFFNVTDMLGLN